MPGEWKGPLGNGSPVDIYVPGEWKGPLGNGSPVHKYIYMCLVSGKDLLVMVPQ